MRHNIYLPDDLSQAVQEAGISLSAACQKALQQEVRKVQATKEAGSDLEEVAARLRGTRAEKEQRDYQQGYGLGVRWAKEEATEAELAWAAETAKEHWISLGINEDNSLLGFLEAELDLDFHQGGAWGTVGWRRDPFMIGLLGGAAEVHHRVTPLL